MMRKWCFLFILFSQIAWADPQSVVNNAQQFSFELLRQLGDKDKNLCVSPYSISSALAMVFQGAKGSTKREIERVMRFTSDTETLSHAFSELNRTITRSSEPGKRILLANSLWVQEGMTILPAFLEGMNTYFRADLHFADFQLQTESARAGINNWAAQATQGKITDLIAQGSVTPATRMVLASAIYMKASWATPFSEGETIKHPFFGMEGTTFSVPMMVNTAAYPYFEDTLAQVIELPYAGGEWSMLCILPREQAGIRQVEAQLSTDLFNGWRRGLNAEQIHLFLPKFKMSSPLDLRETLAKMGMASAFDDNADFSGINGSTDLRISQIIHQAFVNVDESGTEAAAATSVVMALKASLNEIPPRVLKLNRPFLFVIYERSRGAVLFMGRVSNPLE